MRPFWVPLVTAVLGGVQAGQYGFSVHEDLLAFPQYQVIFEDSYILFDDAQAKLNSATAQTSTQPKSKGNAPDTAVSVINGHDNADSHASSESNAELPQSYEYLVVDSISYLCSIPQVPDPEFNETTHVDPEEEREKARELERARVRGSQLIASMDGSCLYYESGWWSYSLCFNRLVKQFHSLGAGPNGARTSQQLLEDPRVPSFVLGKYQGPKGLEPGARAGRSGSWEAEAETDVEANGQEQTQLGDLVELQTTGNRRYLMQKLGDGTQCDLTGQPRRIEIQYHCASEQFDRIASIKEISTCSYRMVIHTPRLCNEVAFQPPKELPQHPIRCREVIGEGDVVQWLSDREDDLNADLMNKQSSQLLQQALDPDTIKGAAVNADPPPQRYIIGDIELGGMKIVGKSGKRIEPPPELFQPPGLHGPGKVEVLARYDPQKKEGKMWKMTDQQLQGLQIAPSDITEIKKMIVEMYKAEPNRKWKIIIKDGEQNQRILIPVVEEEIDLDSAADAKANKNENSKRKGSAEKEDSSAGRGSAAGSEQEKADVNVNGDGSGSGSGPDDKDRGSEEEFFQGGGGDGENLHDEL